MNGKRILTFTAGQGIVICGDPALCAYRIVKGRVRVYLRRDDKIVTLAELGEGAMFGESALFDGHTYGAFVDSIGDTTLEVINREDFQVMMADCPPAVPAIIDTLLRRLRESNARLLDSETRSYVEIALI